MENAADLAIPTKKVTDLVALIATNPTPLPPANKKKNEILDLLHSYIPDILSYSHKRMLSQHLLKTQASSWLITLSTWNARSRSKTKAKRQIRALGITKFEQEPESYKKAIESANQIE